MFDFNQWFFYKNQLILIVIKISDLNHADLNRPTLVSSLKTNFETFIEILHLQMRDAQIVVLVLTFLITQYFSTIHHQEEYLTSDKTFLRGSSG